MCVFALALAVVAAVSPVPGDMHVRAEQLVKDHQLKAALAAYTDLTRSEPDVAGDWIWKARLEAWTRAYPQAEATYAVIARRWPTNVEAMVGHVYLEMWSGRFNEAQTYVTQAETLAPHDVGVLAARVRLFRQWGKTEQARLAFSALKEQYPQHPETAAVRSEFENSEGNTQVSVGSTVDRIVAGEIGVSELAKYRYMAGRNISEVTLTRTQRRSEDPTQLSASYLRLQGQNYWLGANAMIATGAVVTQTSQFGAAIARRMFGNYTAGVSYGRVQFNGARVESITPSVTAALGEHSSLSGFYARSWIVKAASVQQAETYAVGYDTTIGKRVRLIAGGTMSSAVVAQTTEAELGTQNDKTVSLGARFRLSRSTNLGMDLSRRFAGTNSGWLSSGITLTRSW